ncbi:unnamed protein product [Gongylonema pulchrum]|uniref:Uncharacterized protein n=1 Tax=Gongylonema pulchrum TaxID=637853 RepID=A0A183D6S8_9BILA|nr:unnamed protein product [Gongylonema pulchrum]
MGIQIVQQLQGILKRASSHGNFPREGVVERHISQKTFEMRPSPERHSDRPTSKIPKLTLTWSEKNAVAIYGDTTSDETTTETDDAQVPEITPFSATSESRILPPSTESLNVTARRGPDLDRQTAILQDYDDDEDTEMRKQEALDNTEEALLQQSEVETANGQQQTSAVGTSHIAGKWWFGKSTKLLLITF